MLEYEDLPNGRVLLRQTVTDYVPNVAANLVSKPARVRVLAPAHSLANPTESAVCRAEVRTLYDQNTQYDQMPTQGLVTRTTQALTACNDRAAVGDYDPAWRVTRLAYDDWGNLERSTVLGEAADGSQDAVVTLTYDDFYHLFPLRQQEPLGMVETAQYYGVADGLPLSDPKAYWGAMQEVCGVNEVCTRQAYDRFGRPTRQWGGLAAGDPWPSDGAALVAWFYSHAGDIAAGGAKHTATSILEWRAPYGEGNFTRKLYNGLGQLVQTQTPYQDWGIFSGHEVVVDTTYTALGQPRKVSVPHLVPAYTSGDLRRTPDFSQGMTTTAYDALSRPTSSTAPNGERTVWTYLGRASAQWGIDCGTSNPHAKVLNRTDLDALGRPQSLRTYDASSGALLPEAVINLTHDVQDNLVQVVHPTGIGVTTMTYDLASRKTSMDDVDMGRWAYAYDRRGNLTQQIDARSKATCLAYDVLGRLLHKDFRQDADTPTDCASPTYDLTYLYDANHAADNPSRGQLSGVRYNDGSYGADLAYNEQGLLRQKNATLVIAGALDINVTQYGYDAYQRPTTTTYPDGEVVSLTYNGMGLPTSLTSSQATAPLVNGVQYDEAGRLTRMTFPAGGGLVRSHTYNPWNQPDSTGGLLRAIQVKPATGDSLVNLAYTYDSFGNVQTLTDGGTPAAFTYDDQNRLLDAYGLPHAYDPAGRFTTFETNTPQYTTPVDTQHPHGLKWVNLPGAGSTPQTVTIHAKGEYGSDVWPTMELWVNGAKQQSWTVDNPDWADYTAQVSLTGRDQIDVVFPNDYYQPPIDRNLYVDFVQVGATTVQAEGATVYDMGAAGDAFDGNNVSAGREFLNSAGALRFVLGTGATALGYDANGNLSYKLIEGQADLFVFNHENRLQEVVRNDVTLESYLYDDTGQRVKKTSNGVETFYPFPHYELEANAGVVTETKYYFFGSQRVAMHKNGVLSYLHADHLSSTLLATDASGNVVDNNQPRYYAYGSERIADVAALPTDHTFTGQKQDATGLHYFNARYYDPSLGQFISPDTLVPDPLKVLAYNRYLYGYGNPLRYTDPSGHAGCGAELLATDPVECMVDSSSSRLRALGEAAGSLAVVLSAYAAQAAHLANESALAIVDGVYRMAQQAEQAAHRASQSDAGNSGTGDPNDPNQLSRWAQSVEQSLEQAKTLGGRAVETTTGIKKIESQLNSKSDLLGIQKSDNMSSLSNSPYAPSLVTLSALVLERSEGAKGLEGGEPEMLRCAQHDTAYGE